MKNQAFFKTVLQQALFVAVILIGTSSCTENPDRANTKESAEDHNKEKLTPSNKKDAAFLVNAAVINLEEIRLGQLAQLTSKSKDIKDLSQMMEDAHTKSLHTLTALAASKSVVIPTSLPDSAQDTYTTMKNMPDESFDKEYCAEMVSGHNAAIALFEAASNESTDIDIRKWASTTLPELRDHLNQVIICQNKIGKPVKPSASKK